MSNADNYASLPLQDLKTLVQVYEATCQTEHSPELENRLATIRQVLVVKLQAEKWKYHARKSERQAKENYEAAQQLHQLTDELNKVNNNRGRFVRYLHGYMIPAEQMALTELSTFINHRGQIDLRSLYDYLDDYAIPVN